MSNGLNASRLFKEAGNSLSTGRFSSIELLGIWERGLAEREVHETGLVISRFKPLLRRLQVAGWFTDRSQLRKALAAISYFQYMAWALYKIVKTSATHVSVHNLALLPLGVMVKMFGSTRLVYVPHELETERTGLNGFVKWIAIKTEALLIGRCDALVVVCEPIADWYRDAYKLDNVFVVRNVPRRADIAVLSDHQNEFRDRFKIPDNQLIYIYQGLIDDTRGVRYLIQTFQQRSEHIVFMGYGDLVPELIEANAPNIHHHPAVPLGEIKRFTSFADVGLIVIPGKLTLSYQKSLPNKFFEYLHAGIPIIVSANLSYMACIIREHGLGWVIENEGFSELLNSLKKEDFISARKAVTAYAKGCIWEEDASAFDMVYGND
jgi:glycosyltransferase involved in cell wall biosynthesis